MATLDTLSTDTAAALASVTSFISDVNTEVSALAASLAALKAELASAGLTPEQQAALDAADANAQSISSSVAAADTALKAQPTS